MGKTIKPFYLKTGEDADCNNACILCKGTIAFMELRRWSDTNSRVEQTRRSWYFIVSISLQASMRNDREEIGFK